MTSSSSLSVGKFLGTVGVHSNTNASEAEKWLSFTRWVDNWAFPGKAIHRDYRGDSRLEVSMLIILNHCHKKEAY